MEMDPVAAAHNPVLTAWVEDHKHHLLQRTYRLVGTLYGLPDHDEHALHAAVAERLDLGRAGAELAGHLAAASLQGTVLWRHCRDLEAGHDLEAQWRAAYQEHGADGLRQLVVNDLEDSARELEHPVERHLGSSMEVVLSEWVERHNNELHGLMDQVHAWLAEVRTRPHDLQVLAAARQAWSELVLAAQRTAEAGRALDPDDHLQAAGALLAGAFYHPLLVEARSAQTAVRLDGTDTAAAVQLLEHALWQMAGHLNAAAAR